MGCETYNQEPLHLDSLALCDLIFYINNIIIIFQKELNYYCYIRKNCVIIGTTLKKSTSAGKVRVYEQLNSHMPTLFTSLNGERENTILLRLTIVVG